MIFRNCCIPQTNLMCSCCSQQPVSVLPICCCTHTHCAVIAVSTLILCGLPQNAGTTINSYDSCLIIILWTVTPTHAVRTLKKYWGLQQQHTKLVIILLVNFAQHVASIVYRRILYCFAYWVQNTVSLCCILQYSTLHAAHETTAVRTLTDCWLQQQHVKLVCGLQQFMKIIYQIYIHRDNKQLKTCSTWTADQKNVKHRRGQWLGS